MQPKRIAQLIWEAADQKQAVDPVILDISRLTAFAHYFFIAHGNSNRHVSAIAENIQDELKKHNVPVRPAEGIREGKWVLLDFGSAIAHIFYRDLREFFGLERLWGSAPHLKI